MEYNIAKNPIPAISVPENINIKEGREDNFRNAIINKTILIPREIVQARVI
jgi:hypothetical protein